MATLPPPPEAKATLPPPPPEDKATLPPPSEVKATLPPSRPLPVRPPTPRPMPSPQATTIARASSPCVPSSSCTTPRPPSTGRPPSTMRPRSTTRAPDLSQDPSRSLDKDKVNLGSNTSAANPSIYDSPSDKPNDGVMSSSKGKRKISNVKQSNAPSAKRFKSPLAIAVGVKSPGVRLMLSPKVASPSVAAATSASPAPGPSRHTRKRKLTSRIWKEFLPVYNGPIIVQAECMHCHQLFTAHRGFGTSGCLRHLKHCEARAKLDDMITQMRAANQSPVDDSLRKWKFDQEKSEHELVKLIVLHELPFSLVEYSKFRSFVSSLNPYFRHISRTTIKKYYLMSYEEAKVELCDTIGRMNCRVSLTADLWTSNQNLGYLCVTCHIIDDNWKLSKRIIKFISVETPHDGSNLFNAMLRSLQDWNLEERVFAITLDNATTNDSFVDSLKDNLVAKSFLLHEGKLVHYRCAAHVLNLIAQEGLKCMKGAIDNIRESVKYIKSSPSRKERFEKIVHRVGISCTRRPSLDVASRWNSTYEMLISAADYMRAFEGLAKEDPQYKHEPSTEEWKLSKKLCNILKIFSNATKVVSGSTYPINLYFHQIWEVKKVLEKESSSSDPLIVSMVNAMKKKFRKYWDLSFLKICIPVILDPRFKLAFLDFRLKKGFGGMAAKYLSEIEQTFCELFDEYRFQSPDSQAEYDDKDEVIVDETDPWADWGHVQNVQQMKVTSELEDYLSEETVHVRGSFDILEYWKVYSTKYSILARMA